MSKYNKNRAASSKKNRLKMKAEKEEKLLVLDILSSFYGVESETAKLYKEYKKKSLNEIKNITSHCAKRDREILREIAFVQNL